jgi:hypothetical protein
LYRIIPDEVKIKIFPICEKTVLTLRVSAQPADRGLKPATNSPRIQRAKPIEYKRTNK